MDCHLGCIWTGALGGAYTDAMSVSNKAVGAWKPMAATPAAFQYRDEHVTHAWSGTELLLWGGYGDWKFCRDGGLYHPRTDTWRHVPASDTLNERGDAAAIWTGTEFLIWGGSKGGKRRGGARLDPATLTMTAMVKPASSRTPTARTPGRSSLVPRRPGTPAARSRRAAAARRPGGSAPAPPPAPAPAATGGGPTPAT